MKKIQRIHLLLIVCTLVAEPAFGQSVKFTNSTNYLNELSTIVSKTPRGDLDTAFMELKQLWNAGKLNSTQKSSVVKLSNIFAKRRMRTYPHFFNYMKFVISSQKNNNSSNFESFQRFLEQYAVNKRISSSSLSKFFEKLYLLNTQNIIYKSRSVVWKIEKGKYTVETDKDELIIRVGMTNLVCHANRDSFYISNTQGYYSPLTDVWQGNGGKLTWEYADLSKDSVFATINKYKIDLKRYEFKAELAKFVNKRHFSQELTGLLEMKLLANKRGAKASYPKFTSKTKLHIKNIMPEIDYIGCINMVGGKILGNRGEDDKSILIINKDKKGLVKAQSDLFLFNFYAKQIDARNVSVSVKMEKDSITHAGVTFTYKQKPSLLILSRSGSDFPEVAYKDSYHKVEIDVDLLSYQLEDTVIQFKPLPMTKRTAVFSSAHYFSQKVYNKIQMMDRKNPISIMHKFVSPSDNELTIETFARTAGKSMKECKTIVHRLAGEGFVNYDKSSGVIQVTQKLFDYEDANFNKKDYDVISIKSNHRNVNGVINLKSKDLTIYGVKPFVLSYNRRVGILPKKSTIVIKKDLNMEFDGRVNAGLTDVFGNKFKFDYNKFKIEIPKADSLKLKFISETKNQDSIYEEVPVASSIEGVSGTLFIDEITNKSGKDSTHNYPIFESKKTARVNYTKVVKEDTIYNPKDFYFETAPFTMDSLNLLSRKHITMKGTFSSGAIFPNIKESLTVQNDTSLGFIHNAGKTKGINIYKGQGTYYNKINLDKKGLTGNGYLHHLNTDVYSEEFKFYPDSMNTYADNVKMAKQLAPKTIYPKAEADSVYVHWEPKNKKMWLKSLDAPYNMFENRVQFDGKLQLEPTLLGGAGKLTYLNSELNSNIFKFLDNSFSSDSTSFTLRKEVDEITKVPLLAHNVKANVDLKKKEGIFKSKGENSYIDFTINNYLCYMDYFVWKVNDSTISIGTQKNATNNAFANAKRQNLFETDTSYTAKELSVRSKFVSTHPDKDSLSFHAVASNFDINKEIIEANNIRFVRIADIFLFPADKFIIKNDAEIEEIDGAKILADINNNYHSFYNVHAKIIGANKYKASGDYEYIDKDEKVQQIKFEVIEPDNNNITVAAGKIEKDENFKLSPQFEYNGQVFLKANREHLAFEGFTRINHSCTHKFKQKWFPFNSIIDPDSIIIPISNNLISADSVRLANGIFITKKDSIGMYSAFLTKKIQNGDYKIFDIDKGYLRYNDSLECFEMSDSIKFTEEKAKCNHLSLHKELCTLTGKGNISLGLFTGQVKTSVTGTILHNLDAQKTVFEAMLGIDFHFDKNALKMMSGSFNEESTLQAVDLNSKKYQENLRQIVGYENAQKYNKGFELYGGFDEIPDSMDYTIFLSNIKLRWDNEFGTWVSEGKISISNFKKHQILKTVNGIMTVKRVGKRGVLNLYLEINPNKWFFFTYDGGILKTCSSEDDYNSRIAKIKDKNRESHSKIVSTSFAYYPAHEDAKKGFVREMKKRYNFESSKETSSDDDIDIMDYSDESDKTEPDKAKKKKRKKELKKDKKKDVVEDTYEEEEEEEE